MVPTYYHNNNVLHVTQLILDILMAVQFGIDSSNSILYEVIADARGINTNK